MSTSDIGEKTGVHKIPGLLMMANVRLCEQITP